MPNTDHNLQPLPDFKLLPDTYGNQISFSHLGNLAVNHRRVQGYEQQYLAEIEHRRASILEMPNNTDGLDLARVDIQRESAGAPAKEMRFLSPTEFERALVIAGSVTGRGRDDSNGRYLEQLDIVLVKRDPELDDLNGPGFTESIAVHELVGHASATDSRIQLEVKRKGGLGRRTVIHGHKLQTGFLVHNPEDPTQVQGISLEEGFAEYERGQFVLGLGRKGGFVTSDGEDFARTDVILPMPGHYWWLVRDESGEPRPTYAPGVFTASILEILIEKNPAILGALRDSRRSGDHDEVRNRMNAIIPGIYERIVAIQDPNTDDGMHASASIYFEVYEMVQQPGSHSTSWYSKKVPDSFRYGPPNIRTVQPKI